MYKVIVKFADMVDGNHVYDIGEEFPRSGVVVSAERLKELSTDNNRVKKPVIEKVLEETPAEGKPKRSRKK